MSKPNFQSVLIVLLALSMCACSGSRALMPSGGVASAAFQRTDVEQPLVINPDKRIAGTYNGTVVVSDKSGKETGTITVTIMQGRKSKSVSGTAKLTLGYTATYSCAGHITSSKKKRTAFTFTVYITSGNGHGHTTVTKNILKGSMQLPANGKHPALTFTFKAEKT